MSNPIIQKTGRKNARYRCNQKLCVRYRAKQQEFIAYGRCTEVGRGGIGAELPGALQLAAGQDVRLELTIDGPSDKVILKAQVKDRNGTHYSFQFQEKEGPAAAMLQTLFQPDAVMSHRVTS
jgi:hypothetical protein